MPKTAPVPRQPQDKPAQPSQLSARQQRVVDEYLIDLNGTQALIRAGYSPKTAGAQASRLLKQVNVAAAIAEGRARQLATADLSAVRVLEEYRRLAFTDVRAFFGPDGSLKPISEWTPEQGAAVSASEVIIKNAEAGDGITDRIHKFKLWDKVKALDSLAKHFKILEDAPLRGEFTFRWEGEA